MFFSTIPSLPNMRRILASSICREISLGEISQCLRRMKYNCSSNSVRSFNSNKWRSYFSSSINQTFLCFNGNIDRISLRKRYFSNDGSAVPSAKVQSSSLANNSNGNDHQSIESLLATLTARSREISTQASAVISEPNLTQNTSHINDQYTIYTLNDSIAAADVLLSLTSNELIQQFFRKRPRDSQSHEEISLHCAFLSVSNWLCSTMSRSESHTQQDIHRLSNKLFELIRRSVELQLPLTLPTYKEIAIQMARCYDVDEGDLAVLLLALHTQTELYALSNSTPEEPSTFLFHPLKELIKRRKYHDAVMVLDHMAQSGSYILLVEPWLALDLLHLIEEVEASVPDFQPTLVALVTRIEEPLLKKVREKRKEFQGLIDRLGLPPLNDDDDEYKDEDSKEEEEEDVSSVSSVFDDDIRSVQDEEEDELEPFPVIIQGDEESLKYDNQKLNELISCIQREGTPINRAMHDEAIEVAKCIISKVRKLREHETDGTSTSYSERSPLKRLNGDIILDIAMGSQSDSEEKSFNRLMDFREAMLNDSIYVRDQDIWDLPDITAQITRLSKGRIVRFAPDYEEYLLREMLAEEGEKMDFGDGFQSNESVEDEVDDDFVDYDDDDNDED